MRKKDSLMKMLLADKGDMYYALNACNLHSDFNPADFKDVRFGKNSRFYGKLMKDGNVFNPYIHRRFLPAKFKEMCHACQDLHNISFSSNYMLKVLEKECHTLSVLAVADRDAFNERESFFGFEKVKNILDLYATPLFSYYDTCYSPAHAKKVGEEQGKIKRAMTYNSLEKLCKQMSTHYLPEYYIPKEFTDKFTDMYFKAGAYYSIKNEIMFNHYSYKGYPGEFGCKVLRGDLDTGITTKALVNEARKMWGF